MLDHLPRRAIKSEAVTTSGTDLVEKDVRQIFTMATGLRCTDNICGCTTTSQVPDDTDLASKIELLKIHQATVHSQGRAGAVRVLGVKAKIDRWTVVE